MIIPDHIKKFYGDKFRSYGTRLLNTKYSSKRYPEWKTVTLIGFYRNGVYFLDKNNNFTPMKFFRFKSEFMS